MTSLPLPQQQQPSLVSPVSDPETKLVEVEEDNLIELLDQYDLDFGVEGDDAAMLSSAFDFFPKEGLSKMTSLTEMVNSLPEEPRKADEMIAEALQAMSLEEREQIVRELYGIERDTVSSTSIDSTSAKEPDNDPEFLENKLQEMDQQLKTMKTAYGWNLKLAALEMAESKDLEYTQDKTFRLQFLRCDRFDAARAASRFIRYFDWKLELFGEECLGRDITFQDLPKEDQSMIKKGHMQRLPVRDRAGRAIFCGIYAGQVYESPESFARQMFYLFNSIDTESAKRGHIGVFFKIEDMVFKKCNRVGGALYTLRFLADFPLSFDGFHKFMETEPGMMERIVNFVTNIMNTAFLARSRVHKGTYSEWVTTLMSFGIPHDVIPFTQSHKIKTKNHLEYLAMRARAEEILAGDGGISKDKLIDIPSRKDVLLGKGRPIQFSSGNQGLATIVDGYLDQYHKQSTKLEKTALANEIVRMVQANGVRFLSKEHGIWMEVSNEVAREKVSHLFRHLKPKWNKNKTGTSRAAPEAATVLTEAQEQAKKAKV